MSLCGGEVVNTLELYLYNSFWHNRSECCYQNSVFDRVKAYFASLIIIVLLSNLFYW